jgi:hypothetical protein
MEEGIALEVFKIGCSTGREVAAGYCCCWMEEEKKTKGREAEDKE